MNKRFLFSDNGVLKDWTVAISDFKTQSNPIQFVAGEDALFIGSRLPFNSFYAKLGSEIAQSSRMEISYWSDGWVPTVEVIDETKGFSSSGHVTFTPNKDLGWLIEEDTKEIPELASVIIYDYYWLKITFTNDLDMGTILGWIGSVFSNDDDLASEFPDLVKSNVLASYQTGKLDWLEQHVRAAEIIEGDLINRGIIDGTENILDRSWYKNASIQKTAEIIFSAFGDDYVDQRARSREEYGLRLVKRLARVDKNNNAVEDIYERKVATGFLSR